MTAGRARRVRSEGVDLLEPVLQTLRTAKGAVVFGFAGQVQQIGTPADVEAFLKTI